MAFFDFDKGIQRLLILGAIASITALPCGCHEEDWPSFHDDTVDYQYDPYFDPIEDIDGEEAVPDVPEDSDEPDSDEEDALGDAEDVATDEEEDVATDEEEDVATDEEDAPDDTDDEVASLGAESNHGFVRGEIMATTAGQEGIRLRIVTPTLPSSRTSFSWSTSSGTVVPDGDNAVWHPENEPGVHAVQAVAKCDGVICLEVYRIRVPGRS